MAYIYLPPHALHQGSALASLGGVLRAEKDNLVSHDAISSFHFFFFFFFSKKMWFKKKKKLVFLYTKFFSLKNQMCKTETSFASPPVLHDVIPT